MNVLCFNCRGLGRTQAGKDLRGLLRKLRPKLVFLLETKKSVLDMESIKVELGDFLGTYVDARGRSGGLALLWDRFVNLNFLSSLFHHIDVAVQWCGDDPWWRFTGVYGWADMELKLRTGEMIKDLKTHSDLPWLVGGDLNEIFYHSEKMGDPPKSQGLIDAFRDSFLDCD